jgi:mannose-1-phosphate guanylyltransferase
MEDVMFAVVMAGGSGTRFWPVSRNNRPKQFLNISGSDPMIVETCNRINPLVSDKEMIIVLGREHLEKAKELLGDREMLILAEPIGRNTAPCIGLGAIYAQELGCKGAVAFLPADHYIGDPASFLSCLKKAATIAESDGIVTLGIVPTRPETGYGYIKKANTRSDISNAPAFRVSAFVEKPDLKTASWYLGSGQYFWNAGIFVATPDTILREIKKHLPDLYRGLERIKDAIGTEFFEAEFEKVYQELDTISFDYGIMERTDAPVFVLPCECGWSDVGSWESLYDLKKPYHDHSCNLCEGDTLLIDCHNNYISGTRGRLVACLGIDNCLIVDTPDALLVADLNRSQDIRKVVEKLKKGQKEKLL